MKDVGATYEYGSPAAGATTIQRAISGGEVSSPHSDPAGHYPGSECLTPPLPPWPTVARETEGGCDRVCGATDEAAGK